ncbi:DUF2970 domain-containing protein [Pseudoalteromonas sp. McH1-7]|uniref:DUF2970 domain-containing protein n=1 Tax=Pseudoalteromonas peptidolytica F12-50-A1 TaxID=1315280 RepID=A0A8I0MWD5_9GAMM|nr:MULTISPECIES: DUF2970 domain-containing protein [Pseudoalteromonas]MBE0347109.1 hypothetical protein [Pseudoalteromonas peptidolytica F12-50-A1]MDW7549254.1 DUF2970 domain-containing protein [Pseudoalteromonas peptidolytica]NLR15968.1 DUF2970 domain-containing protein [Pseudoalteromonas peptidolytica]NUZ10533.1 DUF2970 domain-containing protein [Pseudoalteromonas sp. McH1-7]RRS08753.1 DUF2970 domain-containing protein [Pseudoalteromonas sp. J010]
MASSTNKLALVQSVCAAMFGVQSGQKQEYDFSKKRFWPFALAGVLFVFLFVVGLIWFVNGVVLA